MCKAVLIHENVAVGVRARVAAPRRAYVSTELWPESERARLTYFSECSIPDGFVHALLLQCAVTQPEGTDLTRT